MSSPSVRSTQVLVIFCGQNHIYCLTEPVQLGTDLYSLMDMKECRRPGALNKMHPLIERSKREFLEEGQIFPYKELWVAFNMEING